MSIFMDLSVFIAHIPLAPPFSHATAILLILDTFGDSFANIGTFTELDTDSNVDFANVADSEN